MVVDGRAVVSAFRMDGGSDGDTLFGGSGADTLFGNGGNDVMSAGRAATASFSAPRRRSGTWR